MVPIPPSPILSETTYSPTWVPGLSSGSRRGGVISTGCDSSSARLGIAPPDFGANPPDTAPGLVRRLGVSLPAAVCALRIAGQVPAGCSPPQVGHTDIEPTHF